MSWVRRLTLPGVTAWLGAAILMTAVIAPAAFEVLPTRSLAGALVGRVLPVLFISGAVFAVAALLARRTDQHGSALVRVAPLIWLAAMLIAQFWIGTLIQRVRAQAGASLETISADDPQRVRFGQLHGISVLLLGVGMVAALILVVDGSRTQPSPEG